MNIRQSKESDLDALLHVEEEAFGREHGAEIVELVKGLLNDPSAMPLLSLLATHDDKAVGHILFTKAHVSSLYESLSAVILAPLAVMPEAQSQGIGGQLIREGFKRLSDSGVELVFVLGHPDYYPRFGFQPAGALGFEAPYPIPEERVRAWMVRELRPGVIGNMVGKVMCADVLNQPEHWGE